MASLRPIMYLIGFLRTAIKYSSGMMMSAWINKPAITVAMYNPTIFRDSMMSFIAATFAAIKLQIPIGENLVTKIHYESTICYTSLMLKTLICNFTGTHLYTWVERGTVIKSKVSNTQEHNTESSARTQTWTA